MELMKEKKLSFLKNPLTILFAIIIAIFLGVIGGKGNPDIQNSERNLYDWIHTAVTLFIPLGKMYLNLLKMTVYPILIAAITSSVAGLVKSPEIGKILSKMLMSFIIMLLATGAIGTLAGLLGQPGAGLSSDARATLGKSIDKSEYKADLEISLSEEQKKQEKSNFIDFFVNIVPRNIFKSLVEELALQLVLFSIVFGIAVGMIQGERSHFLTTVFEGLFKAFQTIISWLMYLLPFGIIFLLAGQIISSHKFFEVLKAMIRFIILFYIVGVITLGLNTIIIWKRSKQSLSIVFKELLDPIIIALATRSSFATLPSAIKALSQRLSFSESTTKLYIPLGITLGRYGNIIYFALAALFVSQLYAAPLTIGGIFIVLIGSIFAGTATAGATGLATLALMSIVLEPLGLPIEAVLILFMTIDTIIDPMRTLLIVHSNMAVNALIAEKTQKGNRRKQRRRVNRLVSKPSYINKIQNSGEIIVAIKKDDEPLFHYRNESGEFGGIDIEIAKKVASVFDVKLRYNRDAETEEDIVNILNNGLADFSATKIDANSSLKSRLVISKPYLTLHKGLLVKHNQLQGINFKAKMAAFKGKVGADINSNSKSHASLLFPNAEVGDYHDTNLLIEAVKNGTIFAAVGNELVFHCGLKDRESRIRRLFQLITIRSFKENYAMMIPREYESEIYLYNSVIKDDEVEIGLKQFIAKYI